MVDDVISGRDALHRLDTLAAGAREEFDAAARAADGHSRRRADLARLKAEGYRELAAMRLDVIKAGAVEKLGAAEKEAALLMEEHEAFLASIGQDVAMAATALTQAEARRREGEAQADVALAAYEKLATETEREVESDPAYQVLRQDVENANAIAARAAQKLELAKTDREAKRAPYESDPLFSYLWKRKFRTTEYRGGGLARALDNWVARLCRYDEAYMNYARLTELPDRIGEHMARMKLEAAEAEASIDRFEAAKLEEKGAGKLQQALDAARARLKGLDEQLDAAEAKLSSLRAQQERAASGDAGPQDQARRMLEEGLAKASFPDLKVLASETTSSDDDRMVDALIKLRTEELQMEVNWRNVEAMPARRRAGADTLELVRRRFKEAGLDGPFVMLLGGAYEAALQAYATGPAPDGDRLWRAILATVRQAPMEDDAYFGGRRRGRSIGVGGVIAGVILDEVVREIGRGGRGRWGGGGFGGGGFGGGGRGGGGFGGGGFKSGGGFGGGGFKTGGKF